MAWYGSNYPPNSGPPPPPGAGGPPPPQPPGGYAGWGGQQYAGYPVPGAYSAYSNTTAYGVPPGYGGAYGAGAQQAYGGAYGGYPSGAVPGFTVPAQPQYAGYPQQQNPMAMPASMQYNAAAMHTSHAGMMQAQWQQLQNMGFVNREKDEDEEHAEQIRRRRKDYDAEDGDIDHDAEKRKAEERARKAEEQIKELQKTLAENSNAKNEIKAAFIQELMRRQAVSGTFEMTQGTLVGIKSYDEEDAVAKWFAEKKEEDIVGEKWNPSLDVQYMREAMKGWGTNEAALITVVSTRNSAQRNAIMKSYKTSYGRDLIKDLMSETSGNFEEALIALFETPARYDAWSVKKAIYGAGTNERTLIEIFFTRTNAQIEEMVQEYNCITYSKQSKPESSVERDIEGDCSGDFKRLLISASTGNRTIHTQEELEEAVEPIEVDGNFTGMFQVNYEKLCNLNQCQRMAKELYVAGEEKLGTDEETFNRIFSTQDFYTLRVVYDQYVKLSQRDIINSVDRETSGDYKKGLLAIVQSVKCRPMFFADRLYHAMKGAGTNDSTLIRIIVSRSELDMVQIKQCFLDKYHKTLWKWIRQDTSGDYRKLLCAIVGKD